MELDFYVPNKVVYLIAPTYDQVTEIYYPIIEYDLGGEHDAIKSSRDLGRWWYPNNVELRLVSYEAVIRMRGKGAYLVVWDEPSSCTKGIDAATAWQGIVQPCIVTRWSPKKAAQFGAPSPGRALFVGTPEGYNFFYDAFNLRERDPLWGSYRYDYTESPLLDQDEIERLKHTIDPLTWGREYLASFSESGNNVFYCFDRAQHVTDEIPDFNPPTEEALRLGRKDGEEVHVAIDFNVGIMAASMFAVRGNQMHFIDEIQGHPDTEALTVYLKERFEGHTITTYPDPTGNSKKTSAPVGRTDFTILRNAGFRVCARKASPALVDSAKAVNAKLMTAAGDVGMYVHPRCTGLIKSMERTKWADKNPDSAIIDKSEGLEHYSDGVRYATEYLYPVRSNAKVTERGFRF